MDAQTRTQSTFVTVLAWIFIVGAGFTTVISILQNIFISVTFPPEPFPGPSGPAADQIPASGRFMMGHVDLFFRLFLALSCVTLISAVGLLRRRNWARIVFIVIFALGIVWNIGALILQQLVISSMLAQPLFEVQFDQMMLTMRIFSIAIVIVISTVLGWLIARLASPSIRSEFK